MSADDRQGQLRLSLVDVFDANIGGRVGVRLRHQVLSDSQVFNNLDASKRIKITNLFGAPQGLYRIEVDPQAYLPTSQFVNLKASDITVDTNNRVVTLKGTVTTAAGKTRAIELAKQTDGVSGVEDQLVVKADPAKIKATY